MGDAPGAVIEARGLAYTYRGAARPAVAGLDFEVREGEIFGFLGPSAAGKSTTQRILIGLLRDYRGEVRALGRDLRAWGREFYERVGVSFEVPNLYLKLTALENLASFRALYDGATADPGALLERVGLAADADARVSQFSKGMKVRLGFARALLNQPELLFLDEPTAGLDPANAQIVKDEIRGVRERGCTVFLTTHNMIVADELCDRVAFLVEGEIRLIESPRELKLRYGRRSVRLEYVEDGAVASREFPLAGLGENPEFWKLLRERELQTLHTQETTLERVFLEVTGRSLA
jgi:fluoroquinolone transport system ATP-binding protein